ERFTQGPAPSLVRLWTDATPAIRTPPFHAVRAAPRRARPDFNLHGRRRRGEVLAVVREGHARVEGEVMERGGERHVAEAAVVAVGLAVGGAVHELRPAARALAPGAHVSCGDTS